MPRTPAGLIVSFASAVGQSRCPGSISCVTTRPSSFQADDAERGLVQLAASSFPAHAGRGRCRSRRSCRPPGRRCRLRRPRCAAQRRAHLVVRVERPQAFVGQREVVRADLGRDAHAAALGRGGSARRCRRVETCMHVDPPAGRFGQGDVAADHHVLGGGGHAAAGRGSSRPAPRASRRRASARGLRHD